MTKPLFETESQSARQGFRTLFTRIHGTETDVYLWIRPVDPHEQSQIRKQFMRTVNRVTFMDESKTLDYQLAIASAAWVDSENFLVGVKPGSEMATRFATWGIPIHDGVACLDGHLTDDVKQWVFSFWKPVLTKIDQVVGELNDADARQEIERAANLLTGSSGTSIPPSLGSQSGDAETVESSEAT